MSVPAVQNQQILVTAPPHWRKQPSTRIIMYEVMIALVPGVAAAVYFFGLNSLAVIGICMMTAVITEAFIQKVMLKQPVSVFDGSAALTGLLLALTLPPLAPENFWLAAVGSIVAIGLGKMVFGGLGYNIFNPALVGRAFLLTGSAMVMTTWTWPKTALPFLREFALGSASAQGVDALSAATPLAMAKLQGIEYSWQQLFYGNVAGSIGETSALLLLVGGIYLIIRRIIDWRIPVSYLATVAVLAPLMTQQGVLFHIFAGGLILGAFFMATDYVTTPVTRTGKIIFGIGCGILTMILRRFGGYPEGVCYAILLMNALAPLIDSAIKPRRFGEVKGDA